MDLDINSRPVVEIDVVLALRELSLLPKRAADDPERELRAFVTALAGVGKTFLDRAIVATLQGRLGHPFFPAPPELRMLADRERAAHDDDLMRQRHKRELRQQRAEFEPRPRPPGAKEKVAAIYADYNEWLRTVRRGMSDADEVDVIRSKYDPAMLARIPDRATASRVLLEGSSPRE